MGSNLTITDGKQSYDYTWEGWEQERNKKTTNVRELVFVKI